MLIILTAADKRDGKDSSFGQWENTIHRYTTLVFHPRRLGGLPRVGHASVSVIFQSRTLLTIGDGTKWDYAGHSGINGHFRVRAVGTFSPTGMVKGEMKWP